MKQPHLEWAFIFCTESDPTLREELRDVGVDRHAFRRHASAGGPGLDEHAVADLAGAGEELAVFKTIVAAEAADGLALLETGLDRRILRKIMKSEEIYATFLPVVQIV